jgi:hypothetical protein
LERLDVGTIGGLDVIEGVEGIETFTHCSSPDVSLILGAIFSNLFLISSRV